MTTRSVVHLLTDLSRLPDRSEVGIFLPTHALFPAHAAAVLMTMPLVDTNTALRQHLEIARLGSNRIYAGIFAADPFAEWSEMEDALRRVGILGIINFPSVALHDDETANHLDEVGLGFGSECDRLSMLQDAGFRIALTLRNSAQAKVARNLRPDFVVLYDTGTLDEVQLARQCGEFRDIFGDIEVHCYGRGALRPIVADLR
jgi:hypothetical protein